MAMDYILNPLICTIWYAKAAQNFAPGVPLCSRADLFRSDVYLAVPGWRRGRGSQWFWILTSLPGFAVCAFIRLNLRTEARMAGTAWALFGVLVWFAHRRNARMRPQSTK